MKKWKIYVGIVVVTAILGISLCMGSKIGVSKVSADVSDINVSEAEVGAEAKESDDLAKIEEENQEVLNDDTLVIEIVSEEVTNEVSINNEYIVSAEDVNSVDEISSEEVVDEEVKEEIVSKAVVDAIVAADPKAKKEEAYKNVLEEEVYIAELVSIKSGVDYNTSNWKECLDYLRKNYGILERDANVDMDKVDSYVFAYNIVEQEQNAPTEAVNKNAPITRAPYSPAKVTKYTDKYWNNYNPAYRDFDDYGGDCANFVSQALYAGGKSMEGSVASNFGHWFCRSKTNFSKISSTWRGADAFGHYWKANAKGYKTFDGSHFTSKKAQQPVYNYTNVGDAISFLKDNGRPYHTVICSYKNRVYEDYPKGSKMIHFASHTGSHKWKSVYNYLKNSNTAIRVYDMY